MEDIYRSMGKRIKQIRLNLDLTQEQLAERADLSVTYVSQIERGQSKASLSTIQKIASAMQIEVKDLFSTAGAHKLPADSFSRKLQIIASQCPPNSRHSIEKILEIFLKELKSK